MLKTPNIPVHRMDDWNAGVYLKSFGSARSFGPDYEVEEPHRHDFYYCVLLEKGAMVAEVDFRIHQLAANTLVFIYPGQVHRILSANLEQGWFLAFEPVIIEQRLRDILDQCLTEVMIVSLKAVQSAALAASLKHLEGIYNDTDECFRQPVLQALVTALGYQVASAYLSMERRQLNAHPARAIEIAKTFRRLLRQNFRVMKKPSEFAASMNLSATHLNDTVKAITGFTVTYYIQHESMHEAQRLLYHSLLSVKEIAGSLGYDDAQYFSRLFRKITGLSPLAFRKKANQPHRPA